MGTAPGYCGMRKLCGELCDLRGRFFQNRRAVQWIRRYIYFNTGCAGRITGSFFCHACKLSENNSDLTFALGTRSLLWIVPGGWKTKGHLDEYSIFIGNNTHHTGIYFIRIEKEKFNLRKDGNSGAKKAIKGTNSKIFESDNCKS